MAWIKARWGAVLLAVAIFAAGVVCGAVAQRVAIFRGFLNYRPGMMAGPRGGDRFLHRFMQNLELTEEQQGQVQRILEKNRSEMMTSRRDVQREMRALSDSTRSRILRILTEEQQEQFESSSFQRLFRGPPGDEPHRGRRPRRRRGRE